MGRLSISEETVPKVKSACEELIGHLEKIAAEVEALASSSKCGGWGSSPDGVKISQKLYEYTTTGCKADGLKASAEEQKKTVTSYKEVLTQSVEKLLGQDEESSSHLRKVGENGTSLTETSPGPTTAGAAGQGAGGAGQGAGGAGGGLGSMAGMGGQALQGGMQAMQSGLQGAQQSVQSGMQGIQEAAHSLGGEKGESSHDSPGGKDREDAISTSDRGSDAAQERHHRMGDHDDDDDRPVGRDVDPRRVSDVAEGLHDDSVSDSSTSPSKPAGESSVSTLPDQTANLSSQGLHGEGLTSPNSTVSQSGTEQPAGVTAVSAGEASASPGGTLPATHLPTSQEGMTTGPSTAFNAPNSEDTGRVSSVMTPRSESAEGMVAVHQGAVEPGSGGGSPNTVAGWHQVTSDRGGSESMQGMVAVHQGAVEPGSGGGSPSTVAGWHQVTSDRGETLSGGNPRSGAEDISPLGPSQAPFRGDQLLQPTQEFESPPHNTPQNTSAVWSEVMRDNTSLGGSSPRSTEEGTRGGNQ